MPTPFVGEVRIFAGNFAPNGWAMCNGQLLSIAQNNALWNVLGTAYGGDGVTTFALPDLRGRAPIHPGQGAGLSSYTRGQSGGVETVTLSGNQMPSHTHTVNGSSSNGFTDNPGGSLQARSPSAIPRFGPTPDTNLADSAVAGAGSGQPHNNMGPSIALNFIIALSGTTPTP
jgi:microcystin-dependent protein